MDSVQPTTALAGESEVEPGPAATEREESRQQLYLRGWLELEGCGFTSREIGRLVFLRWLHLRGRLTDD